MSRWTTGIIENNLSTWNVFAAQDQSMTYDLIYIRGWGTESYSGLFSYGHLCLVKISISAEHSIAIAMRLAAFRRLSPAGELVAHTRWAGIPLAERMDGEVCSSCRESFGDIVTQESQRVHREAVLAKVRGQAETEADNLSQISSKWRETTLSCRH